MKYGEKCSFRSFTHQLIISDEDIHQLSSLTSVLRRKGAGEPAGDAPPTPDLYYFNGRINLCQLFGKQSRPSAPAGRPAVAEREEEKRRKSLLFEPINVRLLLSKAFYPPRRWEHKEQEVEGRGGRNFLHPARLLARCIVGNHPVLPLSGFKGGRADPAASPVSCENLGFSPPLTVAAGCGSSHQPGEPEHRISGSAGESGGAFCSSVLPTLP